MVLPAPLPVSVLPGSGWSETALSDARAEVSVVGRRPPRPCGEQPGPRHAENQPHLERLARLEVLDRPLDRALAGGVFQPRIEPIDDRQPPGGDLAGVGNHHVEGHAAADLGLGGAVDLQFQGRRGSGRPLRLLGGHEPSGEQNDHRSHGGRHEQFATGNEFHSRAILNTIGRRVVGGIR